MALVGETNRNGYVSRFAWVGGDQAAKLLLESRRSLEEMGGACMGGRGRCWEGQGVRVGEGHIGQGRSWPLGRQPRSSVGERTLEELGRGISGHGLRRRTEGVVESRACGEVCLGWV